MSSKFSPERLYRIRRLRRARRLWKQQPIFAYPQMREEYPTYSYEEFCDDLRRRSKERRRRKGRSPLVRYGRYGAFLRLMADYQSNGSWESVRRAMALRKRMTMPYRLRVQIGGQGYEYTLSPYIPQSQIEELALNVRACKSFNEVERMVDAVRATVKNGS